MSVLSKEQLDKGVYMYTTSDNQLSAENLAHILWDIDTMGQLQEYIMHDDNCSIMVIVE